MLDARMREPGKNREPREQAHDESNLVDDIFDALKHIGDVDDRNSRIGAKERSLHCRHLLRVDVRAAIPCSWLVADQPGRQNERNARTQVLAIRAINGDDFERSRRSARLQFHR